MTSACSIWSGCVKQSSNHLFLKMPQLHMSLHFDLHLFKRLVLPLFYPISILFFVNASLYWWRIHRNLSCATGGSREVGKESIHRVSLLLIFFLVVILSMLDYSMFTVST
jgi:magnesium-transporting ATPase (P-type)